VRDALVAWRAPLLARERGLRAVPASALHVTLYFLGERPETAIAPLAAIVEGCAAPVGGLALGAPLWLPRRRPRVLAVALEDRHGALGVLAERLLDALAADGWHEREARPFLPHVTVARVRGGGAPAARELAPPAPCAFAGAALALYRSQLGGDGARYEAQTRVALA
jgi:RNA 2',3'-cyclic 3'-phosphodiesterase